MSRSTLASSGITLLPRVRPLARSPGTGRKRQAPCSPTITQSPTPSRTPRRSQPSNRTKLAVWFGRGPADQNLIRNPGIRSSSVRGPGDRVRAAAEHRSPPPPIAAISRTSGSARQRDRAPQAVPFGHDGSWPRCRASRRPRLFGRATPRHLKQSYRSDGSAGAGARSRSPVTVLRRQR